MTKMERKRAEKVPSGIPGLDLVSKGGLPSARSVVVAGTSGSGKTVFGAQFLAAGITEMGEPGVFVTCEESPEDIRANIASFGWDVPRWEEEGTWRFVDASRNLDDVPVRAGGYDLAALLARIEDAVARVGAKRVVVDSLDALFSRFEGDAAFRHELHRVIGLLNSLGVTTVLTAERDSDYGANSRRGVEEFVADNLILLRNVLSSERRRRTLEIVKFRGATHDKGEFGFSITPKGISVIPHLDIGHDRVMSNDRLSIGNPDVDAMCDGGIFRDSVMLVSGAAGTGKTLLTAAFVDSAARDGERCLVFSFEERREQWFRNAKGWGYDFHQLEQDGLLKVVSDYPEVATLEDHLLAITAEVETFKPQRIAIDSLSALERVATPDSFRKFAVSLSAYLKHHGITSLLTSTTPTFLGGASPNEAHLSTVTDLIILLRHTEIGGELRRGLTVLKMRGSRHDHGVREFTVDENGMTLGAPYETPFGLTKEIGVLRPSTLDVTDAEVDEDEDAEEDADANPDGEANADTGEGPDTDEDSWR
ncbi:MAG: circadian clock protein KaiC [Trueperaceae bacterium]|nr:circadian clock protein KaiC [Trueperaceae bacterium]